MAFWFPMFLGILAGVGLMYLFSRCILIRGERREVRAKDIASLTYVDLIGLRKLCGGEKNVPTWVSFPEYERVNWLNKELKEVWPYISKAASEVIRTSVEPILAQYRPPMISALVFSKFTLGTIAPQIAGVKFSAKPGKEVVLHLDFKWGGNPSIILAVKTLLGAALQVQVKDLQVFGVVRLTFTKFRGDNFPCFGALLVALKQKPTLNFTFKLLGGNVGNIPGLVNMLKDIIMNAILDQLLWPRRLVVPIMEGDYSDLELKPTGQLTVRILRGENLKKMDNFGKSDPYVILWTRILFKESTKVISSDLNPVWNESFKVDVEDHESQRLILQVMDKDLVGEDNVIGFASVSLAELQEGQEMEKRVELVHSLDDDRKAPDRTLGAIHIMLSWRAYTPGEQKAALEAQVLAAENKRKQDKTFVGKGIGVVADGAGAGAKLVGHGIGTVGRAVQSMGRSILTFGGVGDTSKRRKSVDGIAGTPPRTPTQRTPRASVS